jgi:hypothetical protein
MLCVKRFICQKKTYFKKSENMCLSLGHKNIMQGGGANLAQPRCEQRLKQGNIVGEAVTRIALYDLKYKRNC